MASSVAAVGHSSPEIADAATRPACEGIHTLGAFNPCAPRIEILHKLDPGHPRMSHIANAAARGGVARLFEDYRMARCPPSSHLVTPQRA